MTTDQGLGKQCLQGPQLQIQEAKVIVEASAHACTSTKTGPSPTTGSEVVAGMLPTMATPAVVLSPSHLTGKDDPLYDHAVQIVRANNMASISLIQRHLRIAYNRAAYLVEAMEGTVVSYPTGGGHREVLPAPDAQPAPKG